MKCHAVGRFASVLALGACFASNAGADFQYIKLVPATPQAYEPFRMEITTSVNNVGTLVSVDTEYNVITLRHQSEQTMPFEPRPTGLRVVNIPGLTPGRYMAISKEMLSTEDLTPSAFPARFLEFEVTDGANFKTVHALFSWEAGHYFLTASGSEYLSQVTQDAFGTSSARVADDGFNAWPAEGPAPAAARPVCRFYSGLVRSFFYTANEAECEMLKQDAAWAYEGIAFRALVPVAGVCPPETDAIWRLYNGRAAQVDTNHRFVASKGIYQAMTADGWIGEGVAFCSPRRPSVLY